MLLFGSGLVRHSDMKLILNACMVKGKKSFDVNPVMPELIRIKSATPPKKSQRESCSFEKFLL